MIIYKSNIFNFGFRIKFNANKSLGISGGGNSTTSGISGGGESTTSGIEERVEAAMATRMIQVSSGRTKQMQQIVVITIQTVLDFFCCWMITGAGDCGVGGGA